MISTNNPKLLVLLCCFLVLWGSPVARGSEGAAVVVRLINARTGKPIPGKPVRIWLTDGGPPYVPRPGYLEGTTGPDGAARFQLKDLAKDHQALERFQREARAALKRLM